MRRIRGESKNLHGLLANARFDVDDYQREYRWGQDQVSELVADLANAFFKRHGAGAGRIAQYERYFLGPSSSASTRGDATSSTVSSG